MDVDFEMSAKKHACCAARAIGLFLFLMVFPVQMVVAETLVNKPLKCVSLKQGQICTERVLLQWTAVLRGDYCLYSNQSVQPLACWSRASEGEHRLIFRDNVDRIFALRLQGAEEDLATSTLTIAWVYERRGKGSGWRRFWKLF